MLLNRYFEKLNFEVFNLVNIMVHRDRAYDLSDW